MKRKIIFAALLLMLVLLVSACTPASPPQAQPAASDEGTSWTIAMIPKYKGIPYFNACEQGALEAAAELGIDFIWDGPTEPRVDRQIEMISAWIAQGVDAILVSPNDPLAIAPIMQTARDAGILVMTWDADSDPSARSFFVNQASADAIGNKLVDLMVEEAGPDAPVAIITEGLTDANQNAWIAAIEDRIQELGVGMEIVRILPSDGDQSRAFTATQDILRTHTEVRGIWGLSSASGPGVAQAVRDMGLSGEVVVGAVATPSTLVEFLLDGTMISNVLWNPIDLGYLAIYAAVAYLESGGQIGDTIYAGRLGEKEVRGDEILLGEPYVFTRYNVEQFDF